MTRLAQRSLVLVMFAAPLLVVACGGGSSNNDATPLAPDGSSTAIDAANSPNLDGSPDLATSTTVDGPVITPDAPGVTVSPDAPGVTPDAPGVTVSSDVPGVSSDSPVDRGAPDAPGVTPDAPVDADAADAGSDATVDGDAGNSGIQPRVLIIDPATDKFVTYDRDGQTVHDYHAALDFGAGYEKRSVRQEAISVAWDATASAFYNNDYPAPLPGLDEALRPSRIVVVAESTAGLGARFVFVNYGWPLDRSPTVGQDRLLYRSTGELLFSAPARFTGEISFDQTGQLAVLHSRRSYIGASELAIINLSNGQATTLPVPQDYTIVYE
jgi:hypothetical protein